MEKFLTPKEARKHFNVSDNTLRKWHKEGKIEVVRPGKSKSSHRRYKIIIPENKPQQSTRQKICYARVSNREQKKDLERQVSLLKTKYPNHRIIKDIGSGLDFKRKGLKTLLDESIKGNIQELVITNKDRLCRFGFELFQQIISTNNGEILVLYNREHPP